MWLFLQNTEEKIKETVKENAQELTSGFDNAWDKMWDKIDAWKNSFITNIPNIVIALFVFSLSLFLSRYIYKLVMRMFQKSNMQHSAKKIMARICSVLFVMIGLFLSLLVLDLSGVVSTILTGAGVAGLVVGLALQGMLSNTFSGITLSVIKQIKIGDWINTNNIEGEVIDIDFRITTLKTVDNNIALIPNKMVLDSTVKNTSITMEKRVILTCGVGYDSDLELVKKIVIDLIPKTVDIFIPEKDILFIYKEFGDSSITFEVRFYIATPSIIEQLKIKSQFIIDLKKAFDENGINIPFPTRTLDVPQSTLKALSSLGESMTNDKS